VSLDFVADPSSEAQPTSDLGDVRQAHFYDLSLWFSCIELRFVEPGLASFTQILLLSPTPSRLQSSFIANLILRKRRVSKKKNLQ